MANGTKPELVDNTTKNLVGPQVRLARKALDGGITQDQLSGRLAAQGVAIDRAGIAKIELGMRHVYDFELTAISRTLKVDVKWLLGMETTGGPRNPGRRQE